jgi:hypothetical protein
MENELTKEELYTIELALDGYAGFLNNAVERYCKVSTDWEGAQSLFDKSDMKQSPLKDALKELMVSRDRIKKVRHKLEELRTGIKPDLNKAFTEAMK